jgi:hypothetical protein
VAAGIKHRVDAVGLVRVGFCQHEKGKHKVGLGHGLAAAQGEPAAGIAVKGLVRLHLCHNILCTHYAAPAHQAVIPAGPGALHTIRAKGPINARPKAFHKAQCPCGAGQKAVPAEGAVGDIGDYFRVSALSFGVVTPLAVQKAALEKDRGPETWAVIHAHALDVVDNPQGFFRYEFH